jgi:hypothetical protein
VLRISIKDDAPVATLMVEGKLVGPWAAELGNTWRGLWAAAERKPLRLDLCGLSFVDRDGTRILREIVKVTGAEVFADSPLTQHFANQAKSGPAPEPVEEN